MRRYRYGFNGKEKDEDGEWGNSTTYTTLYRQYHPGLGRFFSIDPEFRRFADQSPYSFSFNSPILVNDPNGDCPNGDCDEDDVAAATKIASANFDSGNNQKDASAKIFSDVVDYITNKYGEDAVAEDVGLVEFNSLAMNIYSDMSQADFLNESKAATYVNLIAEASTPSEIADLVEMRAMWVARDATNLQLMGLGLQALASSSSRYFYGI